MPSDLPWKLLQNLRDHAMHQGEEIASVYGFSGPPVDPLEVVAGEQAIHAEGDDLGEAFDGCLEYVGNRQFLLAYNTKYNAWPHEGDHHPKVRFTIGHELGHYFLDEHRGMLVGGGPRYTCVTEFQVDPQMEHEADCFAAGLLMPSYLLNPLVNRRPEPSLADVRDVASRFRVSMTSMLVRWVRVSHFPCAVFSVTSSGVRWGWVSEAFVNVGAYRRHNGPVRSRDAQRFFQTGSLAQYREGNGLGYLHHWVEVDRQDVDVREFYAVIPYHQHMLVFITGSEDDLYDEMDDE
jgi:hypothetical protein